jgi:hypothetical protein
MPGGSSFALPRHVPVTLLAYLTNLSVVSIALYWWTLNGYVALYVFRRATV